METETVDVLVNVTAAHIARGKPGDEHDCPIVRALIDLGFNDPDVMADHVAIPREVRHTWERTPFAFIDLPDEAQGFINVFDAKGPVEPFSFTLPVPIDALPEGIDYMPSLAYQQAQVDRETRGEK